MKRMNLLRWGVAVFGFDATSSADPGLWLEKLDQAQAATAAATESEDPVQIRIERSGPDYVAAICIRDHWDELKEEQRNWCGERVCAECSLMQKPAITLWSPPAIT
jgi:hypothetical protein